MKRQSKADFVIQAKGLFSEKSYSAVESIWSWRNRLAGVLLGAGISIILAILFYRSFYFVALTGPFGAVIYRSYKSGFLQRAEAQMMREIRDGLLAVEIAIRAGYAMENAIYEGEKEIARLWGQKSIFLNHWREMERQTELKIPVEISFQRLSERTGIAEISELAQLLATAKRSGGSLAELLKLFVDQLGDKMTVQSEIEAGLTEKRMEKNMMLVMPPAILVYLMTTSYEWIAILYEGTGRIFMTAVLGIYAFCWVLGERLLNIRV